MFFKYTLYLCFLSSSLAMLVSCSGDNQKAKIPELKAGGCLSGTSQVLNLYLEGAATPEQINLFWNCMQATVSTLEKYAEGSEVGRYKSTELRKFLEDRLLKNAKISDDLLNEVMQIKRLIVKGDIGSVTRLEIIRLQAVMEQFRTISLRLAPHMEVLTKKFALSAQTPEGREKFQAARTAFSQILQNIGQFVANNKEDYDLSRLEVLLREIDGLSAKKERGFSAFVPLAVGLKGALVSQPSAVLASEDFPAVFKMAGDMLFIYLKSAYYVDETWEKSPGIDDLNEVFERGARLIQDGAKRKPDKVIAFEELRPVFDAMEALGIIPLGLKAEAANDAVRVLFQRAFKTSKAGGVINGITADGIQGLREEWQGFINAQKYAEKSVNQKGWAEPENKDEQELMRAGKSPFPLEKDSDARLILKYRNSDWFFDLHSLTGVNWQRLIIRLLIKGYATKQAAADLKGLTRDQLMQASKDLWTLGLDVGFFTPDKPDIYKRVFQEANLFMPRSNGDEIIDYEEGVDYLAFALSGINMRSAFLEKTAQVCPMTIVDDEKQIDAECFRHEMNANRFVHMGNMPNLVAEFARHPQDWQELEKNFEITVRKKGFNPKPVTGSEIAQFFILSHYLEMFMLRFDENNSQSLNLEESYVAFGVYKKVLAELLSGFVSTEDDLLNIYTFMFNYGDTPLSGMGGMLRYVNWRVKREMGQWEYEADRVRLSQILSSLSSL